MSDLLMSLLWQSVWEIIYMVAASGFFSVLVGLPLGIILFVVQPGRILAKKWLHKPLALVVDLLRAIPFIILLVMLIPFTRFLVGTSIGTQAAIVPLSIGAVPFVARLMENALKQVNGGLVEAGQAMGATNWQIIYRILLPEALPAAIRGVTVTLISLVGYSAMAGAVGGGGLGSLAINYGYQRFDFTVLLSTIMILVMLVYMIQWLGDKFAKHYEHF